MTKIPKFFVTQYIFSVLSDNTNVDLKISTEWNIWKNGVYVHKFTCNTGDLGSIPGSGRSLKKGMATYSNILAWRIPWAKGAWLATVLGVSELKMTDWLTHVHIHIHVYIYWVTKMRLKWMSMHIYMCVCAYICIYIIVSWEMIYLSFLSFPLFSILVLWYTSWPCSSKPIIN